MRRAPDLPATRAGSSRPQWVDKRRPGTVFANLELYDRRSGESFKRFLTPFRSLVEDRGSLSARVLSPSERGAPTCGSPGDIIFTPWSPFLWFTRTGHVCESVEQARWALEVPLQRGHSIYCY